MSKSKFQTNYKAQNPNFFGFGFDLTFELGTLDL
jgi:hypothetical protein